VNRTEVPVVNNDKASEPMAARIARQHQQAEFPYSGTFGNDGYVYSHVRNRIDTDAKTVAVVS
jgi:hypothetical protein